MREQLRAHLTGRLSVVVKVDGRVERELAGPNLILDGATEIAHRALGGDAGAVLARVAVGNSSAVPTPADVGPVGDSAEVVIQSIARPVPDETVIVFRVEEGQANTLGVIAEFVLLSADGTAFARTLRGPIVKNDRVQLEGTWTLSGSLTDGGA